MGITFQVAPISNWPGKITSARKSSPFRSTYTATLDLLDRELAHLRVRSAVIELSVVRDDIRIDGCLRANARPSDPRVILSFEGKNGPMRLPCDRYCHWHENLRAIGLSLNALRSVDRYGVTQHGEQYAGWQALPPPTNPGDHFVKDAAATLCVHSKGFASIEVIAKDWDVCQAAYRQAARLTHPDGGGSASDFKKVQEAFDVLKIVIGN